MGLQENRGSIMEENLKKALLELLVLALLYERDNHVPALTAAIAERSGGTIYMPFIRRSTPPVKFL